MQTNATPDMSKSTVWEAFKAYIRRQIISYSAQLTRMQNEKRTKITRQITELDRQCATSPTPKLLVKKTTLQTEFRLRSTTETTKN